MQGACDWRWALQFQTGTLVPRLFNPECKRLEITVIFQME